MGEGEGRGVQELPFSCYSRVCIRPAAVQGIAEYRCLEGRKMNPDLMGTACLDFYLGTTETSGEGFQNVPIRRGIAAVRADRHFFSMNRMPADGGNDPPAVFRRGT